MGRSTGKDCLPGIGGFFSVWIHSPQTVSGLTRNFQKVISFFWEFFLSSWYHTLCCLVVPAGILQGPSSGRWHFGKDWERWSWIVQIDSNNNSIKNWIKHIHPVLCLDPKELLTHFSQKCQDVSQMGWLWQALSTTQGAQREMLIL